MRATLMSRNQLRNLMLTGPPHRVRKRIWLEVTGAALQIRDNEGYYALLLAEKRGCQTAFMTQIEKDLQRTYPDEGFFELPGAAQSLRNVLVAYSCRNPLVGYCQGMNFIAGRLLSFGFSEEQAFWVLAQVLETYLPLDYFTDMSGVKTDQKVFHSLLKLHVPRVAKHLQLCGMDPSMYCVQWLVCVFAYSFRRDIVMRIWDVFFVEGGAFLFRVGLGVLHLCRDAILATSSEEELIVALNHAMKSISDPDLLLLEASLENFMLKSKHIRALREQYRHQMELGDASLSRRKSYLAFRCSGGQLVEDYVTTNPGKEVVQVAPVGCPSLLYELRDAATPFLPRPAR